jgi:translation initiation factor IF-2
LGYITETDVLQAQSSKAYVLGFNSYATPEAEELARTKEVTVKSFEIIYDYLDFVAKEAAKKLNPEIIRKETGRLKLLKIFRSEKDHIIAGAKVVSGEIFNKTKVDHYKNKKRIGQGTIDELQSGKEEVNQVVEGQEAGLKITGLRDPQPGDELVNFQEETKEKTIEL